MAGHFYPLPPTFIGGRQPYAPKLGIAQSGPPSQPTRALATLGIILASWAQAAPALPKQVKIAPLIATTAAANPPYTRKQFERIDAAWRADVTTVITLTSIAPFADPPPAPDVAPIKGYKTVDLIRAQWKAREYLPPQPKGLASLLPPAAVPDAPPVRSHALLKLILDQSLPAAYRPQVSKPIAALLPAATVPDYPPPASYARLNLLLQQWAPRAWWPLPRSPALIAPPSDAPPAPSGANLDIIAEQWQADTVRLPQGAKFAPLLEPISQSDTPPSSSNTNFATIVGWWQQHAKYDLPTSSWPIHVDVDEDEYPDVAIRCRIRLPAGGIWIVDPDVPAWCEVDWSAVLPVGVTLLSVVYELPLGVTADDTAMEEGKWAIRVDSVTHGAMYQIQVTATLSNAETMQLIAPLRSFNE